MEEGYLAKIVCGDGAKEIKVGEVHICYILMHRRRFFLPPSLNIDVGLMTTSFFL